MGKMERMCEVVEMEIGKIADNGLTQGNLETAYKLIDMYKDIKNTKYWDAKEEYYMAVLDEMHGGGSSYAMDPEMGYSGRHRDSRGRYARNDGRGYNGGNSYNDGYSMRRSRGYSGAADGDDYDRYMEHKHAYRSGEKSSDCKQRMIDALERHLDKLTSEIGEMGRDSDCQEERDTIMRYVDKLKRMM